MLLEIQKKVSIRRRGHPLSARNLSPYSHFSLGERLAGSPAFGSRISSLRTSFCPSASASLARRDSSSALSSSVKRPPPRWGAPFAPGGGILARRSDRAQADTTPPSRSPSILAMSRVGLPWARSLRASLLVSSGYFACFSWAQAPGTRGLSHSISPRSQALSHFLSVSLFGPPQGLQAPPQVSPSAHILCRWKAFSSSEYDTAATPLRRPGGRRRGRRGHAPASNFLPHPRSG